MIKIKCFGIAKEIVNSDVAQFNIEKLTVSDLRKKLNDRYKALTQIKGYMVAVNQEYAMDDQVITIGDEVAIIPPVSGG